LQQEHCLELFKISHSTNTQVIDCKCKNIELNDQFEKGKEAEIGKIRVKNGIKWKKVSEEKWAIDSKSEEKKPDQEVQTFLSNQIVS